MALVLVLNQGPFTAWGEGAHLAAICGGGADAPRSWSPDREPLGEEDGGDDDRP